MSFALGHLARAWWRTRRLQQRFRSCDDVLAWRARRLGHFLRRIAPAVPFYAGLDADGLEDLPIVDKAVLLAQFDRFNRSGVTLAQARAALDRGEERVGGLIVGQSTGTSGNRGVFVISEAERFIWLGVILAKALPDFPLKRRRVALALPGFSSLYASARRTGRLELRFFDLGLGITRWRQDLIDYAPDTLVAPPKVLRALAEAGGLRPTQIFSAAEVLDPLDRTMIEAGFGLTLGEIYMATEGLFGVSCPRGVLHLAEDAVAFEFEPVAGSPDLVAPLVTDFTRSVQVMARYRMNDLLRLRPTPCPCGSPLQAVAAVEGRQDDVLHLPGAAGGAALITPDIVRSAVVDADRRIEDFRVVQTMVDGIVLSLAADLPAEAAEAAARDLALALARAGAGAVTIELRRGLEAPMDRKLRRVRRDWRP